MRGREQFRGLIFAAVVTRCLNEVSSFQSHHFQQHKPNDAGAEPDHPKEGLSNDRLKSMCNLLITRTLIHGGNCSGTHPGWMLLMH